VTPGEVVTAALELRAEAQARAASIDSDARRSIAIQSDAHHSDAAPPLADEPVAP
jgi:hypothetical protein